MNSVFDLYLLSIVGGILPALVWLAFFLREDSRHPEPRGYILRTFILGAVAVPFVIPIEQLAESYIGNPLSEYVLFGLTVPIAPAVIVAWSTIEEVFKYAAAYFGGLRTKAMDEPVDALIYMITAALGFAALENTLFMLKTLNDGGLLLGLATGNVRFIGATLLHTASSATIGAAIGLTYYRSAGIRTAATACAIILAVLLHALFNLFIMDESVARSLFFVFTLLWTAIVVLILVFEKIKRIKRSSS